MKLIANNTVSVSKYAWPATKRPDECAQFRGIKII